MGVIEILKGVGGIIGIVLCILFLKKFNKINQPPKSSVTKSKQPLNSQETQKKESSSGCLTFVSLYFAIMVGPPIMLVSLFASDNPDSKTTTIIGFLIGLAITVLGIYIVVKTTSKNHPANK